MRKAIYLIRHTAPAIAPGTCYGQLDIDVADSFADEAQRIHNWLPTVELILASPLLRTVRLGTYLAQAQQCPLHSDARLMEKHFGVWEGRAWNDIPRSEVDAWAADIIGYSAPGGESVRQMLQRAQSFLNDFMCQPQQRVAIVAHGGSIRALLALFASIPITDTLGWQIDYGSVIGVRS